MSVRGLTGAIYGSAEFDGAAHRLRLDRWWGDGPQALVCMANPSDAGADRNDPTIHRLNVLLRNRCDGYTVVNWETYIAPSPADLYRYRVDAWSKDAAYEARRKANIARIAALAAAAEIRIIAWGNLVPEVPQTTWVLKAMSCGWTADLHAFGLTKDGKPKHPMARGHHRIADDAELVVWRPAGRAALQAHDRGGTDA